jgi:hypothetical protein
MSRADKVVLRELERLGIRRAAEVQMAVLALERALEAAEQSDALARIMWPDVFVARRRASVSIREALDAIDRMPERQEIRSNSEKTQQGHEGTF